MNMYIFISYASIAVIIIMLLVILVLMAVTAKKIFDYIKTIEEEIVVLEGEPIDFEPETMDGEIHYVGNGESHTIVFYDLETKEVSTKEKE